MRATGFTRPIVWTFLPTPLAHEIIGSVDPALTIYYCIDDLASSSADARRIVASEERLFRDADLVFVTSEKLRQRAARSSNRVHLFPFGVNLESFRTVRASAASLPDDLAALPRPIAGYVGGLHQWLDQDLLAEVARAASGCDVCAGRAGRRWTCRSSSACPTCSCFGQRAHADVPRYVRGFDVGLVPYRIAEYTANVYPDQAQRVPGDGHAGRRHRPRRDSPVQRRARRRSCASRPTPMRMRSRSASRSRPRPAAEIDRRIAVAESNGWEERLRAMSALIDEAQAARDSQAAGWEDRLRRLYAAAQHGGRCRGSWRSSSPTFCCSRRRSSGGWPRRFRSSSPAAPADAIVVFAGGVGESGKAGGGYQERVTQAIGLYRAGMAPRLIFSSGFVFTFREAEVMKAARHRQRHSARRDRARRASRQHLSRTSRTRRRILNDRHWTRVLLVSSPYHMRRAMLTWKKVAPEITVIADAGAREPVLHPRARRLARADPRHRARVRGARRTTGGEGGSEPMR